MVRYQITRESHFRQTEARISQNWNGIDLNQIESNQIELKGALVGSDRQRESLSSERVLHLTELEWN